MLTRQRNKKGHNMAQSKKTQDSSPDPEGRVKQVVSLPDYWDDDILDDEICGYECLACGNIQDDDSRGGECERCAAHCLDPIYI